MRKVLVDNHEDDYEVESGDTGKDMLSLTAVCCVPVTVTGRHASQSSPEF